MIESISLKKRHELNRPLTWQEVDTNWQHIENAVNYLLQANWQKDFEGVAAGELVVVHDFGLTPKYVTVWQRMTAEIWEPVATPDVKYKEADYTAKLYIHFPDAPGTIRVIVKF